MGEGGGDEPPLPPPPPPPPDSLPLQRKDLLNSTKETFNALLIRICISSEKRVSLERKMAGSVESLKLQSRSNN